jgi:hypothetical protein
MGGPSRRRIFGDRVRGAKISAEHARQRAKEAAREADAAECLLWSEQMEGFGGPAQPSPTIAQCLNGGYGGDPTMAHVEDDACAAIGIKADAAAAPRRKRAKKYRIVGYARLGCVATQGCLLVATGGCCRARAD